MGVEGSLFFFGKELIAIFLTIDYSLLTTHYSPFTFHDLLLIEEHKDHCLWWSIIKTVPLFTFFVLIQIK